MKLRYSERANDDIAAILDYVSVRSPVGRGTFTAGFSPLPND
jgi:hypothetical protein